MDSLDYIVLFLGILVVVVFLVLLVVGKKITNSKKYKYFPLIVVALSISSTLILSHYSENQFAVLVSRFEKLLNTESKTNYDSLSFTKDRKNQIIDSLRKVNDEYKEILQNLKKQELIVGNKSDIIPNVEKAIKNTSQEIYKIESYNEIINDSVYRNKLKGYTVRGSTSKFVFQAPKDATGEYLDFVIKFKNEKTLNDIVIYLAVHKKQEDGNYRFIFDRYYEPKNGINAFRINNYLKVKDTEILIGYFLKKEIGKKKYPTFESIKYSLN